MGARGIGFEDSRGQEAARQIFDRVKKGYHPVAAKDVESILQEAGI